MAESKFSYKESKLFNGVDSIIVYYVTVQITRRQVMLDVYPEDMASKDADPRCIALSHKSKL
jgi:hypothetical protein